MTSTQRSAAGFRPGRLYHLGVWWLTWPLIALVDAAHGHTRFGTGGYMRWAWRHWSRRHLFLSYSRSAEYAFALEMLEAHSDEVVFDIGTGTSACMVYAAQRGLTVAASDYDPYVEDIPSRCSAVRDSPLRERFHILRANGMQLPVPDASLTRVFCISTVEHIPEDGDLAVMREIARVLAPGGRAVVTTEGFSEHFSYWEERPFHVGFQYQEVESARGVPEEASPTQSSLGFYRFYDPEALEARLATVEGLHCIEHGFLIDRLNIRRYFPDTAQGLLQKFLYPWRMLAGRASYRRRPCPLPDGTNLLGSVAYVVLEKPHPREPRDRSDGLGI